MVLLSTMIKRVAIASTNLLISKEFVVGFGSTLSLHCKHRCSALLQNFTPIYFAVPIGGGSKLVLNLSQTKKLNQQTAN